MHTSRRASQLALLVCVATAAACGGGDHTRPGDVGAGANGTRPPGGGNAVGAPDKGGNGGAPVSRIKIPELHQQQGFPPEQVKANLEEGYSDSQTHAHVKGIRELCGNNELCVNVVIEHTEDDSTYDRCQYKRTDPPLGSLIERGGTIAVITGTQPCRNSPPPDGDGESPGTDEQSPDAPSPALS